MNVYEEFLSRLVLKITDTKAIILLDEKGNCKFYNTEKFLQECVIPLKENWMEIPDKRKDAWWCNIGGYNVLE